MSDRYLAWVYPDQFDGPFEPSGIERVDIDYEAAAEAGHAEYERRANEFGYKTRARTRVSWTDLPTNMRNLMRAAYVAGVDAAVHTETDEPTRVVLTVLPDSIETVDMNQMPGRKINIRTEGLGQDRDE